MLLLYHAIPSMRFSDSWGYRLISELLTTDSRISNALWNSASNFVEFCVWLDFNPSSTCFDWLSRLGHSSSWGPWLWPPQSYLSPQSDWQQPHTKASLPVSPSWPLALLIPDTATAAALSEPQWQPSSDCVQCYQQEQQLLCFSQSSPRDHSLGQIRLTTRTALRKQISQLYQFHKLPITPPSRQRVQIWSSTMVQHLHFLCPRRRIPHWPLAQGIVWSLGIVYSGSSSEWWTWEWYELSFGVHEGPCETWPNFRCDVKTQFLSDREGPYIKQSLSHIS